MSRRNWIILGVIVLMAVGVLIAASVLLDFGDIARVGVSRGGRGGFHFGGMMLFGGFPRLLLWAVQILLTALIAAWIVRRWLRIPSMATASPSTAPSAVNATPPPAVVALSTPQDEEDKP